jgi:hypothetical protein
VPNLYLAVSHEEDEEAKEIAAWDQQVRVPFLGHLSQLLFETFSELEPTFKATLELAKVV